MCARGRARLTGRYIPALGVVLLSVNYPVTLLDASARMVDPTAICVVRVRWEGLGFRPVVGSRLTGRIVLETASNVSLLLFNTFSATIDRSHIGSADDWRFDRKRKAEYPGVSDVDGVEDDFFAAANDEGEAGAATAPERTFDAQPTGCWVNRHDGETLGGLSGRLTFTVTRSVSSTPRLKSHARSLTVSGLAITAHGSLLDDPFAHPDEGFQRRASSMLQLDSDDEAPLALPPAPLAPSPPPPEPATAPAKKKRKAVRTTPEVAPPAEPVTAPAATKGKKRRRQSPPPVAATAPAVSTADAPAARPPKKKRARPDAGVPVPAG